MKTFETEYKNFYQRLLNLKNFLFLVLFIFYSNLIFILKPFIHYPIIIELLFSIIFIAFIISRSKTNIHIISFNENNIIFEGETFNKKWEKSINIKETKIILKSTASKYGLCSVTFYLKFKNTKDIFIINSFETYSEEQILDIFNEYKKLKEEKIILDERFIILRIQEKIEKCPFNKISSK